MMSGKCGKNLRWWLSGDTLTISGEGEMECYFHGIAKKTNSPWCGNKLIKKIILKEGVINIGDAAFFQCTNLKEIIIPYGVTSIGGWAFASCKNLTSIIIPDSVISIGELAFSNCTSLKEIRLPASVAKISFWIFRNCTWLEKIYYKYGACSEDILSEGNDAQLIPYDKLNWTFAGKTLTVGGISEIKKHSAEELPWLDELHDILKIVIEEGIEKIAAHAFDDCTRLEQLIIPASVKTIGDFAFTFCYCGDRKINGGKNVLWSLTDGKLIIKKNPAAKSDADFSTGYETWDVIEKNIASVEIERGVIPSKNFFEWLARMGNDIKVSF